MVAVTLDALVGCWATEQDGKVVVEESVDWGAIEVGGVGCANWRIGGIWWHCCPRDGGATLYMALWYYQNIPIVSFAGCMERGHNGKFVAKNWRWEDRSPQNFQGAQCIQNARQRPKFFQRTHFCSGCLFFLLLFFLSYWSNKIVTDKTKFWIPWTTCLGDNQNLDYDVLNYLGNNQKV